MKKKKLFGIALILIFGSWVSAIVGRHDVSEEDYQLLIDIPYLVDLPFEGHAVLIDKRWLITVGHTIFSDYRKKEITIGDRTYKIDKVILHPEYVKPPLHLFQGDSKPLMDFFRERTDLALIKLNRSVRKVDPIPIYVFDDETGKTIDIYGKGATGNGLTGEIVETKSQKTLRHCRNVITAAEGKWLTYTFDKPEQALPLEGMHGSGDSGGPLVLHTETGPLLVGLSSWQYWEGNIAQFKGGLYSTRAKAVRLSYYTQWIKEVIEDN